MSSRDDLFEQMRAVNPDATDEEINQSIDAKLPAPVLKPVVPVMPGGPLGPSPDAPPVSTPDLDPMVKDYVAKKYNLGDYSDQNRKKLQEESKLGLGDKVGAALASMGAGFMGKDPSSAGLNKLKQIKDEKRQTLDDFDQDRAMNIQNVELQRKADQSDPNSRPSKVVQDTIRSLYKDKFSDEDLKNVTAADADLILKPLELKAKLDEAHANTMMKNELLKQSQTDRQTKLTSERDNKDAMKLEDTLSKGWTARSGQAGVVQNKINAAEASEALIEQAKNQPGGLDSRQIEELAQSTSRLLGGGTQASARVDALVPHTFWGKAQSMKEYLMNKPSGQDMQAFTDRLAETVAREKTLAQTQKKQFQVESLAAHERLRNSNPDLYNKILQTHGIEPEMIDDKGRYKSPTQGAQTTTSAYPKQVRKGNQVATVSNSKEEQEANDEGFQ